MKINTKQAIFILLGLILTTIIFTLSKLDSAIASKQNGKKFGDWTVACTPKSPDAKNSAEICTLTQQLDVTIGQGDKQEKKPIAFLALGHATDSKELRLSQILPLGSSLQSGTALFSSGALVASGHYTICQNYGCNAITIISEDNLKTLLASEENSLIFVTSQGKEMPLPFSVKGLKKGLQYIKSN